jgi:hypothetical protein
VVSFAVAVSDHSADIRLARSFVRGEHWAHIRITEAIYALPVRSVCREDVEDIRQDLCVRLMAKPSLLQGYQGKGPLSHYLARCLKNIAQDRRRARERESRHGDVLRVEAIRKHGKISVLEDWQGSVGKAAESLVGWMAWAHLCPQRTGRPRGLAALIEGGLLDDLHLVLGFLGGLMRGDADSLSSVARKRIAEMGLESIIGFRPLERIDALTELLDLIGSIAARAKGCPGLKAGAAESCRRIIGEVERLQHLMQRADPRRCS